MVPVKTPRLKIRPAKPAVSPDLGTWLNLDVRPSPERQWEGDLKGEHGAASDHTVFVRAQIGFHGGLIAGEGSAPQFPRSRPPGTFSLTGTASGFAVSFALWFADESVGRRPFACDGALDAEAREMRGTWSFHCFNPETCGCDGGGGVFHLWRVE